MIIDGKAANFKKTTFSHSRTRSLFCFVSKISKCYVRRPVFLSGGEGKRKTRIKDGVKI